MEKQLFDDIFDAQNKLRTDPISYIPMLKEMLDKFENNENKPKIETLIVTKEDKIAVKNAIKFLSIQEPIHALKINPSLINAAQEHADNQEKGDTTATPLSERMEKYCQWRGEIGENVLYCDSKNGGHEIVLAMLIDDGVRNIENFFNHEFNYVGIGLAKHPEYDLVCVMDYATSATELPIVIEPNRKPSHDFKASCKSKKAETSEKPIEANEDQKT